MDRILTINSVPAKVFTPTTVHEYTGYGLENGITEAKTPPAYGVVYGRSIPLAPGGVGLSTLYRFDLMQPKNPALPYLEMSQAAEGGN